MRRVLPGVLVASLTTASGAYGQANCTRTFSGDPDWNDAAYSEHSMSYNWSGGKPPRWFAGAVGKWNACSGSPALSVGTQGRKKWTVKEITTPLKGMTPKACGRLDPKGTTIFLVKDKSRCSMKRVFLHEMGHSLGLAHDGPGCPATIMKAETPLPYKVSPVNCRAVERFKQEKINRDKGIDPNPGGGGGDLPGLGTRPGRGDDDPISRCLEDPDMCVEMEARKTCTSTSESEWDEETMTLMEVITVTCTY